MTSIHIYTHIFRELFLVTYNITDFIKDLVIYLISILGFDISVLASIGRCGPDSPLLSKGPQGEPLFYCSVVSKLVVNVLNRNFIYVCVCKYSKISFNSYKFVLRIYITFFFMVFSTFDKDNVLF